MTRYLLRTFHKGRAGFTVIELMAAIAITSIISLGASISSAQLLNQTSSDTNYTAASRHAMNAIYWISRDAIMAQDISGYGGFPLTDDLSMTWVGWDNNTYSAEYTVDDGKLLRTLTVSGNASTMLVAQCINTAEDMTYCSSDNNVLTITITSSVGEGARMKNATKTREITNRPNL